MGALGQQILGLIQAGQNTAANEALAAQHPAAVLDTIYELAALILGIGSATSGSSVAIGTGSKTFTLAASKGLKSGTPVYIMETGSPSTRYMVGRLSADEASSQITVSVSASAGSGTYTSWTILVMLATTTVASPPLAIADGGTGASTAATARAAFGVPRVIPVAARTGTPAEGAALVAIYPAQAILVASPNYDEFAGKAGQVARTANGGTTWTFEVPTDGDLIWVQEIKALFAATDAGGGGAADGVARLSPPSVDVTTVSSAGSTYSPAYDVEIVDRTIFVSVAATISLPNQAAGTGYRYRVINTGTGTVTINVASAGTINGAASLSLTTQWSSALLIQRATGAYVEAD